ncbi:MAG: carbonic anhydrase [Tistlia sp.]|uniref:carbonic anhydrase n=1 Tax=Tistlia sp. TaxID=3057121 RepID=UPI0034A49842
MNAESCCIGHPSVPAAHRVGRRRFVQLAGLGAGLSLLVGLAPRPAGAGTAEVLLLSCMDYRLVDDVGAFMAELGLTEDYDHVILAGASAGAVHPAFADWHATFWEHLQAAIDLHQVQRVMVIDHRDCGAYKIALGSDHLATPDRERDAHSELLGQLAAQIAERQPALAVETYLMALDGSVERIG